MLAEGRPSPAAATGSSSTVHNRAAEHTDSTPLTMVANSLCSQPPLKGGSSAAVNGTLSLMLPFCLSAQCQGSGGHCCRVGALVPSGLAK